MAQLPIPPIPKVPYPPSEMLKLPGVKKYADDMNKWWSDLDAWRRKTSVALGLPIAS